MIRGKMRIALICYDNPFLPPAEGGKIGMLTRINSLALNDEYIVDVYLHCKRSEGFATINIYGNRFNFYQFAMNRVSPSAVVNKFPICVNKRYVKDCLLELNKHEYDVAIYEGEQIAKYRFNNNVKAKKHILYFHDLESEYRTAIADSAQHYLKKIANKNEAKKFKQMETHLSAAFDYFWFVSKDECKRFGDIASCAEKCLYIPIPALEIAKEAKMRCESNYFIYIGDLSVVHNYLSIKWFVDEVFPTIKNAIPNVQLKIIGRIDDTCRESLEKKGVEILGYVDDLAQIYNDALFVICPVLFGAGVKVKVIDALAKGKLVVTTTKGIEGTELISGEHLFVNDDSKSMAEQCIDIMNNPEHYMKVSTEGLSFIQSNHTIDKQLELINCTIRKVINN